MSDQPPPGWGTPPSYPPAPPTSAPLGSTPPGYPQPGSIPEGYIQPGWVQPADGRPGYLQHGPDPGAMGPQPPRRIGIVLGVLAGLGVLALIGIGIGLLLGDDAADAPDAAVATEAPRPAGGAVATTPPPEGSVFDLQVGDCFDAGETSEEVEQVDVVPCDQTHENEVFHIIDYVAPDQLFPGAQVLNEFAETQCQGDAFTDYVGSDYANSRYFASQLTPTEASWEQGDREVLCLLYDPTTELDTSVRGSGR